MMQRRGNLDLLLRISTTGANVSFLLGLAVSAWNAFPVFRYMVLYRHIPEQTRTYHPIGTVLFFLTAIPWVFFEVLRRRVKEQLKPPSD